MRRQDAFGIERPSSADRIAPRITPPEGGDLYKPIKLPRPFVGARGVVFDIQDHTVSYTGEEFPRAAPRAVYGERPLSTTNLSDLTPPSQIRGPRVYATSANPTDPIRIHQQPLQTATDRGVPPTATIPRAVVRPAGDIHNVAEPPLRNPSPVLLSRPFGNAAAALPEPDAETESLESVTESIRGIHQRALFRNSSLMYQRFTFSLTKFPALVLVLMALWTLWGRGEGFPKSFQVTPEKNADIAALVTGGFILCAQVLLLHQHYNHYNKAKIMSYLYHIAMLLAFCGAAVSLVFAATSFSKIKQLKGPTDINYNCKVANLDPTNPLQTNLCLTKNQRIDYMGVVIGSSALVIVLSLFTMIAGAIGQFLMADRLAEEYKKIAAAKENASYVDEQPLY